MNPARARLWGAALLLAALAPACTAEGPQPPATTTTATTATPTWSPPLPSVSPDAGSVRFEVYGPPGARARIDWGVQALTSQTTTELPSWHHVEVAPLEAFSATLQVTMTDSGGLVSCRITVEGQEVISNAEPRAVLCTAMNLRRSSVPTTPRP